MKLAVSSASFSAAFTAGALTQLEWLDICANELEVDGVVFDTHDLPRRDGEYLAQLKKSAADLGLSVAALEAQGLSKEQVAAAIDDALALGAPLVVLRADERSDDPQAWGALAQAMKSASSAAKLGNVTLALRPSADTLCASVADCKQLAKDVDSAWLRFTLAPAALATPLDAPALLTKAVMAVHAIGNVDAFARAGDAEAHALLRALARFRGFIVLEHRLTLPLDGSYHAALERFATLRATALAKGDENHTAVCMPG